MFSDTFSANRPEAIAPDDTSITSIPCFESSAISFTRFSTIDLLIVSVLWVSRELPILTTIRLHDNGLHNSAVPSGLVFFLVLLGDIFKSIDYKNYRSVNSVQVILGLINR